MSGSVSPQPDAVFVVRAECVVRGQAEAMHASKEMSARNWLVTVTALPILTLLPDTNPPDEGEGSGG